MRSRAVFINRLIRDPTALAGLVILITLVFTAIFAPYLAPYPRDVYENHPKKKLQPPSWDHPCGTDTYGRDIFSRILFGGRITIIISVTVVGVAILIGVPIGLIAGYYQSWFSEAIMRISDIFLAIPQIILAMALAHALGPSIENVMLALSATYWPWFARIVMAETNNVRKSIFIEATEALGASSFRTICYHVLPNVLSPIIVRSSIGMGFTILTAAVLGYLGLGAQSPTPEWGVIIADARDYLPEAWWFATFPGLAIFLVVMGFNLLGDGLRDVIDPRIRRSGK